MRSKTVLSIGTLCALLVVQGCGDPSDGNGTGAGAADAGGKGAATLVDPCDLITRADAERLLGEPVKPAERREQPAVGLKLCIYNPENDDSMKLLQIGLTQQAAMPYPNVDAASIYQSLKDNFADSRTDVPDLGEDAFVATGGLYVLDQGDSFTISSGNSRLEAQRAKDLDAGRLALERLRTLRAR